MRNFISVLVLGVAAALAIAAEPAQKDAGPDLSWAFPARGKEFPDPNDPAVKHVPGSAKAYTQKQIDDPSNPPDWFPDEHAPMPEVVKHGSGASVPGCAMCHLASGLGHPESAYLAGLSAEYLTRQLADFKSGARKDYSRMAEIAKGVSDDDAQKASEWFAALQPVAWTKVVEADSVPKTFLTYGRMRLPLPEGGTEPLGKRIIIVPQDPSRSLSRDPHSGFIAYVPVGSLAKGERLVTTGDLGKTTACDMCHGDSLQGMDDAPRIAGLSPIYIFRQLYGIQTGTRNGQSTDLMKDVVTNLSVEDMVAISAYVASREP